MSRGSVNKVILIGTLGRDPDVRYTTQGQPICSLSVATNEGYKDKNSGQQVDKTEWHRVEAFGRLAEVMGEYLRKGSKCYIEGKLKTDEYEKDGIKRYSTKIVARDLTMLTPKSEQQYASHPAQQGLPMQNGYSAAQQGQPPAQQQTPRQQASHQPPTPQQQPAPAMNAAHSAFDEFDDDIPFMRLQHEYLL